MMMKEVFTDEGDGDDHAVVVDRPHVLCVRVYRPVQESAEE